MTHWSVWRQYFVIDRSRATGELHGLLDPDKIDLDGLHGYLAKLFLPGIDFDVVQPPVWQSEAAERRHLSDGPDLVMLPLQLYREKDVDALVKAFNQYLEDYYRRHHQSDPVYLGLSPSLAVVSADYCGVTEASGYARGTRKYAERLIGLDRLTQAERDGINGQDVNVVLVDEGINKNFCVPAGQWGTGWALPGGVAPGLTPIERARHSAMVIRNILAIAPKARLFDLPLIRQPKYGDLIDFIDSAHAALQKVRDDIHDWQTYSPGKFPGPWIIVNAWAPFDLRREFPKGAYSNNPLNKFNILINDIVSRGIDVVFCAGNCGAFSPDGRCGPNDMGPGRSILGAASLPRVLSVGAVRVDGTWCGFSSQGPGQPNLSGDKPDLCAPSGFAENHDMFAVTNGTSGASAIAAGVVAALRTKWRPQTIGPDPDTLRSCLYSEATPPPPSPRSNRQFGHGILNIYNAYRRLHLLYP
jgi:hypothetical protein